MNLILFDKPFENTRLEPGDPKAVHLRKVLRVEIGSQVYIGFINGLRARAEVSALGEDGSVDLTVTATESPPPPLPIQLLLGLPRPHTAKRILFEAASMGVGALHFFEAERGEPSYAQSSLWSSGEWQERLRLGAEQSFGTHLPEVAMHADLQSALSRLEVLDTAGRAATSGRGVPLGQRARIALDNYEAVAPLVDALPLDANRACLALGPERGWSPGERDIFRKNGWMLAHLGPQVLRAETACTAALAVAASRLCWQRQTV
ncbi:MAG: RsmE family RNA methyltransferase [Opitutales bacterium]